MDEALGALARANAAYLAGDLPGALEELERAERHARAADDERSWVTLLAVLVQWAGYLREMGRAEEARQLLARAEAELGRVPSELRALALVPLRLEQGIVAVTAGQLTRAEELLREAQAEARKQPAGNTIVSDILANLASVYVEQGKFRKAQSALKEAVEVDRATGNARALANDLNLLGVLYGLMGEHSTAEAYLEKSLREVAEHGLVKEAADAITNLASRLDRANRQDAAQALFQRALDLYEQTDHIAGAAKARSSLGIVAAKMGDTVRARQLLEGAYASHLKMAHHVYAVRDLLNLASFEHSAGQPEAANQYAVRAVAEAEKLGLLQVLWAAQYLAGYTRSTWLGHAVEDPRELAIALHDEVLSRYSQAADAVELLRAGLGRAEERKSILWDKEDLYEQAVLLAAQLRDPQAAFLI